MRPLTLRKYAYIPLSIAVMACAHESEQREFSVFDEVKLQAHVLSDSKTRVINDNEWSGSERLGVFMIKNTSDIGNDVGADSSDFVSIAPYINLEHSITAGTTGELTNQTNYSFRYPSDDSSVNFVAYYPFLPLYTESDSELIDSSDESALRIVENDGVYLYPIDMSMKDVDHDFLFAQTTEGYSRQNNGEAVVLQFRRMMAKLVINVKVEVTDTYNNTSVCDAVGVSAQIERNTQANFNLSRGKLQDISNSKSLAMDASNACVSAIVIPNKGCTGDKVVFTYANHSYTWSTAGIDFKQGLQYNYTLTLRPKNIDVVLNSTITSWEQISGDDQYVGEDGFDNSSDSSTGGSTEGNDDNDSGEEEGGDDDDDDDRQEGDNTPDGEEDDDNAGGDQNGEDNTPDGEEGDDNAGGDQNGEDNTPDGEEGDDNAGGDQNGEDNTPDGEEGDDNAGGDQNGGGIVPDGEGGDDNDGGNQSGGDNDSDASLTLEELRTELLAVIPTPSYDSSPELTTYTLLNDDNIKAVTKNVYVKINSINYDAIKLGYLYNKSNRTGAIVGQSSISAGVNRVYFYALSAGTDSGSASITKGLLSVTVENSYGAVVKEEVFYPELDSNIKASSSNTGYCFTDISVTKDNLYVIDLTGIDPDCKIRFEKTEGSAVVVWGINFIDINI